MQAPRGAGLPRCWHTRGSVWVASAVVPARVPSSRRTGRSRISASWSFFTSLRAGGGPCTQQPGSPACSAVCRWCRHIPSLRKGFRSPAVSRCSPLPACPARSESYSFSAPCDPCKSYRYLDAPKFGSVLYPATWIMSALRIPAVATRCSISLAVN